MKASQTAAASQTGGATLTAERASSAGLDTVRYVTDSCGRIQFGSWIIFTDSNFPDQ